MRLLRIITAIIELTAIATISSCEKQETEFGNSYIYFTNTAPQAIIIKSVKVSDIATMADSTINYVTIYRSGRVDNLEQITINLTADCQTVSDLITLTGNTDPIYRTELMKRYAKSVAASNNMFSIPSQVTIPAGKRSITVPITLKRSTIIPFRNDDLNYSIEDLNSSAVDKNRMLVFGLRISSTSSLTIRESGAFCYLELIKAVTITN